MATSRSTPANKPAPVAGTPAPAPKPASRSRRSKAMAMPVNDDPNAVKTKLNPEVAWPFPTGQS